MVDRGQVDRLIQQGKLESWERPMTVFKEDEWEEVVGCYTFTAIGGWEFSTWEDFRDGTRGRVYIGPNAGKPEVAQALEELGLEWDWG